MKRLLVAAIAVLSFLSLGAWFSVHWETEADFNTALAAGWLAGDWPTSGTVNKFGYNADVDTTEESIWDANDLGGPLRCFQNVGTTAAPFYISSDDEADAGLGVTVEVLDSTWAKSEIAATLGAASASGTVFAQIGSESLLRVNRAFATSDALTGNIYIGLDNADADTDGIPDTPLTDIVAVISAGENQTLQACYTVPLGHTALLTSWCKTNASQAAASTAVTFRWRKSVAGAASRNQSLITLGDEVTQCTDVSPPLVFTEKTDIEVTGGGATSQAAAATFGLLLVPNTL